MQLTGAEIVVECLKEQGVDTVFGPYEILQTQPFPSSKES